MHIKSHQTYVLLLQYLLLFDCCFFGFQSLLYDTLLQQGYLTELLAKRQPTIIKLYTDILRPIKDNGGLNVLRYLLTFFYSIQEYVSFHTILQTCYFCSDWMYRNESLGSCILLMRTIMNIIMRLHYLDFQMFFLPI